MIIENMRLGRRQLTRHIAVIIDGINTRAIVSFVERVDRRDAGLGQLTIRRVQHFHRSVEDGKRKCELTAQRGRLIARSKLATVHSPRILFRVTNILHCTSARVRMRMRACLHARSITRILLRVCLSA